MISISLLRLRIVIFVVIFTVLLTVGGTVIALSVITVGSIRHLINVEEPITCAPNPCILGGSNVVELNLAPGEEQREETRISNSSEKNIDVMFTYHINPEGEGITVEGPSMFLVPGEGSTTQVYTIKADRDIEPQVYSMIIQVERGDYGEDEDE